MLKDLYHHKLGDLASYYGIDTSGSHRTLKDVKMTLAVFYKLQEELLNQFGTFARFYASFSYEPTSARNITATFSQEDSKSIFYHKHVVITGTLEGITRREAIQYLCNIGASIEDQVTIKTDYLIVGKQRSHLRKSMKLRMAKNLKIEGFGIQLVSDTIFLKELNRSKNRNKKISNK